MAVFHQLPHDSKPRASMGQHAVTNLKQAQHIPPPWLLALLSVTPTLKLHEEGNCNLPVNTQQQSFLANLAGIAAPSGMKFGSYCSCKNSQKAPEYQLLCQSMASTSNHTVPVPKISHSTFWLFSSQANRFVTGNVTVLLRKKIFLLQNIYLVLNFLCFYRSKPVMMQSEKAILDL